MTSRTTIDFLHRVIANVRRLRAHVFSALLAVSTGRPRVARRCADSTALHCASVEQSRGGWPACAASSRFGSVPKTSAPFRGPYAGLY